MWNIFKGGEVGGMLVFGDCQFVEVCDEPNRKHLSGECKALYL